jgi:pimeloyl-ACP methyl ester carboxylesterase
MQTMVPVGSDALWAEDSDGPGRVLVLLHSGISDSRMWDPIWPDLAAVFRVIRYDSRGYGQSTAATEEFTRLGDLRAVLAHFGITHAHFAGCSMGGGAAVALALAEPDQVASLVLLCPGIAGYPWPEEPEVDAEYEALLAAGDEEGMLRLGLREWAAAGDEPFVVELMRSAARALPSEEFEQESEPTFDRLEELRAPTVIMVGDRDRAALVASNEEAARRIPGCRLIMMPGVDHYPTVREPLLVAQTILDHCRAAEMS